ATSGRELLEFKGHSAPVSGVAFSSDGKRILTGAWDHTARLWDATSGRDVLTLQGHAGPVFSVTFSPDGQWIVTGSYDQTAKIWRAATPKQVNAWQEEERQAANPLSSGK